MFPLKRELEDVDKQQVRQTNTWHHLNSTQFLFFCFFISSRSLWPYFTQRQPHQSSLLPQGPERQGKPQPQRCPGETRWVHTSVCVQLKSWGSGNRRGEDLWKQFGVFRPPWLFKQLRVDSAKCVCVFASEGKKKVSDSSASNWMLPIKLIGISGLSRTYKVSPRWPRSSPTRRLSDIFRKMIRSLSAS